MPIQPLQRRTFLRSAGAAVAAPLFRSMSPGLTFAADAESTIQVATFRADLTPPLGEGACIGFMPTVASLEHPLEMRGIVLRRLGPAGTETFVIAALDYQGLCNSTDDLFRRRLAKAAGTSVERVAIQSLHQHTAPVLDVDGAKLLFADEPQRWQAHAAFAEAMAERAGQAVNESLAHFRPLSRVVASMAKVARVASNRRVVRPDGSVVVRGSSTRDAELIAAPEGLIDPWLRTVTFMDGAAPLAQLHYYATHPQSFYGDSRISWDVPGMARDQLEQDTGIFQIYFTGCGGNIGMGKYNNGTHAARETLWKRLYAAMRDSSAAAMRGAPRAPQPEEPDAPRIVREVSIERIGDDIAWDVVPLRFEPRDDGEFGDAGTRDLLRLDQPFGTRLKAAMFAAWTKRLRDGHKVSVSRLRIGGIELLHLPGEPFVEFQLFAQQAAPESFVCVAGYGECGVWYYGLDSIFTDRGGYEQTWSFTAPCQRAVEEAIDKLLASRNERLPK